MLHDSALLYVRASAPSICRRMFLQEAMEVAGVLTEWGDDGKVS